MTEVGPMEAACTATDPIARKGRRVSVKLPFIIVFCHGEKYFFRYTPGHEDELISVLVDFAMDERLSFGWPEVRSIMRHFGFMKSGEDQPQQDEQAPCPEKKPGQLPPTKG